MDFKGSAIWRILKTFRMLTTKSLNKTRVVRLAPVIARLKESADFPGSSATDKQYLDITLTGLSRTIPTWLGIMEQLSSSNQVCALRTSEDFEMNQDVLDIRKLLDHYGSDKGSRHQYDLIYSDLMKEYKYQNVTILEIGLGTNNTDTPSNMGKLGKPGASVRAWRDYFTKGEIVGCDIDSRILFTENRISTYQLDQTNDLSWSKFIEDSKVARFNFIIDDGLHTPFANLMTLKHSFKLLTPDGVLVIEDIAEIAVPLWRLIALSVKELYKIEIVKTNISYVVICRKMIRGSTINGLTSEIN